MTASRQRKRNYKLLIVYIVFVFINIALNRIVKGMGLPLYVDNVGTLCAAVFGGYLPGMLVGYITNVINATADPENLFYAGVSVLIAMTSSFFAQKGFYDKFHKALITVPFLAFVGGVMGSGLTWMIYGPGEVSLAEQLYNDFLLDLADKLITVMGFYAIKMVVPQRYSSGMAFTDWRQKPMTRDEIAQAKKIGIKGMSLSGKISALISVIMVFISLVTTFISFTFYKEFALEQYSTTASKVAQIASLMIDGDRVDDYLAGEGDSADYISTAEKLDQLKNSEDYIEYIYVYQVRDDGYHVVFDFDTDEVPGEELGAVIPYDRAFEDQLPQMLAGEQLEPVTTFDRYGWLLMDYEPVYDSAGKCVCYACCDIDMESIALKGISFLGKILSLFLGFFLMIMVLFLWFSKYHFTYPLAAMTYAASRFDHNNEEELETSLERLKSIDISTEDEIETLYDVLTGTISDTVGFFKELTQKGEQIEEMQNGLIYILADLVESRDKYTGDHIRKTAAYVELILELLQEEGVYADEITEEYVKDVCHSAPLHDVGKIKISDTILNKPARLTDEEFEQMKKHTLAGSNIIEGARKLTGDSGYLDEAQNLAAYHHEKWDGSGYPTGLKGEEIPLSARIMAIADVFDALMSKRSYKEPFTIDQAMKIIEDGAGTHFDPEITRVFLAHRDRVMELVRKNEKKTAEN